MTSAEAKQLIGAVESSNLKLSDKRCLLVENLTLSAIAQSLAFTGISSSDVKGVAIKVKKAGAPADATHLVRYSQVSTVTPTTSVGMWMGDGDYFEITNKTNVSELKVISADGLFHILTIEYYG